MKGKINQRSVAKLEYGEILWDSQIGMFGARKDSRGNVSYFISYYVHGKKKRLTLGNSLTMTPDEARLAALEAKLKGEPSQQTGGRDISFGQLYAMWVDDRASAWSSETKRTYDVVYQRHILPHIGHVMLEELNQRDLVSVLVALRKQDLASTATFAGKAMKALLKWGMALGLVNIMMPDFGRVAPLPRARQALITDDQIKLLWGSADHLSLVNSVRGRLTLLTGQRFGQVSQLRRDWVYGDRIEFPPEAVKAKRHGITVHLTPFARAVLDPVMRLNMCSDLLFGKRRSFMTEWKELAGIDADIRMHDCRRSFRSWAARNGHPREAAEMALTHRSSTSQVEATYQVYRYEDEIKAAFTGWQRHIQELVA